MEKQQKTIQKNTWREISTKVLKALHWIVGILNKHAVEYSICGGLSAFLYGAERSIKDIDIDIADSGFKKIYEDIEKYITRGPDRYKWKKFNTKIMHVKYHGQEIDIGSDKKQEIFDETKQIWVPTIIHFSRTKKMVVDWLEIQVIDPQDLIDYKKLLVDEKNAHQLDDILAVEKYIKNTT